MAQTSFELLESLVSGHQMTPDELDDLLSNQVAEDLYLDYKHGNELTDRKKAANTIRQYMSGFANSAGGILIIGVDESTWSVTGATAPGGGDLANWASRCLTPIASYFSPVPRFQVLSHSGGNVLVAVTARSLGIVPCIETGKLVHYFRIHDQTLEAPEYLVSDVLLGRRRQPYLQITNLSLNRVTTRRDPDNNYDLIFTPGFIIENQSLLRAKNVRVGIVSLVRVPLSNISLLSNDLLSYVKAVNHSLGQFSHEARSSSDIEPFSVGRFTNFGDYWVPLHNGEIGWIIPYRWKAAVYVTSEEGFPLWYQLSLTINSDLLEMIPKDNGGSPIHIPNSSEFINIERLIGTQPVVALES